MWWTQTADTSGESALRRHVSKFIGAVGKKPHLMLELLDGVEQAQPWSSGLSTMLGEMEECLDVKSSSPSSADALPPGPAIAAVSKRGMAQPRSKHKKKHRAPLP